MELKNYINANLFLYFEKNSITLIEEDIEKAKLQRVRIIGLPDDSFGFSLDKKVSFEAGTERKAINEFLGTAKSIDRRCDGVIICKEEDITYVLICELKSHSLDPQDYEYQLINVRIFVDYILDLYKKFTKQPILNEKIGHFLFYRKREDSENKEEFRMRVSFGLEQKRPMSYKTKEIEYKIDKMSNFIDFQIIKAPLPNKIQHIKWEDLRTLF